jgi:endonuclease/exonuclease/phosphatase family metal-dependent hydrolase
MKAAMMICCGILFGTCTAANAQWDPQNGDWLKSDTDDYRVMSWNVQDGICRTNPKLDEFNNWNAIVRIIASMQPDVLILQECGDNSGNQTGSGVDSVSQLTDVCDMLIHGGTDTFLGGEVTSYVQKFTGTGYDLPYIFVSTVSDNFNRNVILSRYPFEDINGGGGATGSTFALQPDAYQLGGTSGIRGYQIAEINLPDEIYAGDIVIGNGHYKAGGSSSDYDQRERASQNLAYLIDYYYNGAGTGMSDPNNKVSLPGSGTVLDEYTPVVVGGDLNETPGNGPAEFIARAENFGGTDGTDRDGSDSSLDLAFHPVSGDSSTQGSSSKLDYLIYQDSITTPRRRFIFRSSGTNMSLDKLPDQVLGYQVNPVAISTFASDHRPVLLDLMLPEALVDPCPSPPDFVDDDTLDFADISLFVSAFTSQGPLADLNDDGEIDFVDISLFIDAYTTGCP